MPIVKQTFSLACLLGATVVAWTTVASAQDSVKVVVANADALMATGPDTTLPSDLFTAMGETSLWHLQMHNNEKGGDVLSRTMMLISLASPEKVEKTNQQGTMIEVSPISDFDAFVAAIDYGDVVSRNDEQRTVRVNIRPEEISEEKVRSRLDRVGDQNSAGLGRMMLGDEPGGFTTGGFGGREDETPDDNQLGGAIAPDNYVEIELAGQPYAARVLVTQRKFNDDLAQLKLLEKANLERAVPQRRLKQRLQKVESFTFWAPFERLRKLSGPPVAKPVERTWTDATGKFKIIATYGGLDGANVRLKKSAGNEVKVPLAKLCDADRKYVDELKAAAEANANPFADKPAEGALGSLRADWSGVKQVRPKASRKWSFTPPKTPAIKPATLKATSLEVGRPTDVGPFGEDLEELFIADDGSSAAVVISVGHGADTKRYVQRLDFAAGTTEALLELPAKSKVLDIDPAQRIVLLGLDDIMSETAKVYVNRLETNALTPVCDWSALPPNSNFKDLEAARVIGKGRVMTQAQFGPWVVWGANNGKAEFLIELEGSSNDTVELTYGRRLLVADGSDAVSMIDLVTGKHLASLPHRLSRLDTVVTNPALTRLAIAKGKLAIVVDLATGELLQGLQGGLLQRSEIDFAGDLLLVDNQYLLEPTYPVLLWEYAMARDTGDESHAQVVADRIWYAVRNPAFKSSDKGPWNVVSIPAPHDAVKKRLAELGGLDSLVILNEGDEVSVEVDTDLDADTAKKLQETLSKAIGAAGYKVVEGPAEKQVIVICKAAAPVEVQIADPDAKPPEDRPLAVHSMGFGGGYDNWRMVKRTVTPYDNVIVLRRKGETLWADASIVRAGARFYPIGEEKVDDVVRRIEKADPERLLSVQLPGRMCRRGDATPAGAYGASLLDAEGVVEDKIGKPVGD